MSDASRPRELKLDAENGKDYPSLHMKTRSTLFALLFALVASAAQADSPHFIGTPQATLATPDYCVAFKEAGLGNLPITYTITAANAVFTFQCFTRSNNEPQGEPNNVSFSNLSTQTTITPHNGQITGSLCLSPEQDGAHCQGNGLILKLIHVSYVGVTFCDSTNNVCVSLPSLSGGVPH